MNEFLTRLNQPFLKRIIDLLPSGETVYLVGGAIRDALLNRPNYDLDFVTSGDAIKIARQIANALGAGFFPLDTRRNVARLILKPIDQVEVQKGTYTRIDFSTFQGTDLMSDLQGRDFTMNAMAVEVHHLETLVDPLGGLVDLVSKRLRTCSDQSINNDPVRILRAVRFSIDLGLTIPAETLRHLHSAVDHLPDVSAERLRDELFRILVQLHPSTSLRLLDKLNALEYILPEVSALKSVQQSSPHIMNVWDHTMTLLTQLESLLDVLAANYNPDRAGNLVIGLAALRLGRYRPYLMEHLTSSLNPDRPHRGLIFLAGLYHDVGKPKAQSVDETGKIKFINHEQLGSDLVVKRGQALKLSSLEIERLSKIVNHHMRPSLLSHPKELPSRKSIYRFFRATGSAGVDICILSLADILATYGPTLPQERWAKHLDVVRELLGAWWEDRESKVFPPAIINGDLLMEALDLSPGPVIGYLLESIREAQVVGDIHTSQDAISLANTILREDLNKKTGGSSPPVVDD